jgi:phospholipase C
MPTQEQGTRPACGLGYSVNTYSEVDSAAGTFALRFLNTGTRTAVFHVRSGNAAAGPWTYTVQPQGELTDSFKFESYGEVAYDLSVYGPNGFFRTYKAGSGSRADANFQSSIVYSIARGGIIVQSQNLGEESAELQIRSLYDNEIVTKIVEPVSLVTRFWSLQKTFGWYNLVLSLQSDPYFQQRFAGHLETGKPSRTDPHIGSGI